MRHSCLISLVAGALLATPGTTKAYNLWDFHVSPTVYCQLGGGGPTVTWRSDAQFPNNQVTFVAYGLGIGVPPRSVGFFTGSANVLNSWPLNLVVFGIRPPQELSPQILPNGWYVLIAIYWENQRWWQIGLAASNWFFVSSDGQGCPPGAVPLSSAAQRTAYRIPSFALAPPCERLGVFASATGDRRVSRSHASGYEFERNRAQFADRE